METTIEEEQNVKLILENLCRSNKLTEEFYKLCIKSRLVDRPTVRIVKNHARASTEIHGMATFLLCLVPLGGVALGELVKVLDNFNIEATLKKQLTATDYMTEAWEKHHLFIIRVLLDIQVREIEIKFNSEIQRESSHLKQKISTLQQQLESKEKVIRDMKKEIKKHQKEINQLTEEVSLMCVDKVFDKEEEQPPVVTGISEEVHQALKDTIMDLEERLERKDNENEAMSKLIQDHKHKLKLAQQQITSLKAAQEKSLRFAQDNESNSDKNEIDNKEQPRPQTNHAQFRIKTGVSHDRLLSSRKRPAKSAYPGKRTHPVEPEPAVSYQQVPSFTLQFPNLGGKQPTFGELPMIGGNQHMMDLTKFPTILGGSPRVQFEKPTNSKEISAGLGGKLDLGDFSYDFAPGALEMDTEVTCIERDLRRKQMLELEGAELAGYIRPGRTYNLTSQPHTLAQDVFVETKIPDGEEFGDCHQHCLIVHQKQAKRRKNAPDYYNDITDKCHSAFVPEDHSRIGYHIPGFGEYQEYWIIKLQEKDLAISKLQQRLRNARNLGTLCCNFTAFIPRSMNINTLHVICSNQEVGNHCPLVKEFQANQTMIQCGQKPGKFQLHHEDAVVFREGDEIFLDAPIDIKQVRGQGQVFQLSINGSQIPQEVTVERLLSRSKSEVCAINIKTNIERETDPPHVKVMRRKRNEIINVVEFKHVKNHLVRDGILSNQVCMDIQHEMTNQEKMSKLLDILCAMGNDQKGFKAFCIALRKSQIDHLASLAHNLQQQCNHLAKILQTTGISNTGFNNIEYPHSSWNMFTE